MKKSVFLIFAVLIISLSTMAHSQSMSNISKGVPLNSNDGVITGFAALATPSITLSNTAVKVGTVPNGTVAIIVSAEGPVNFGDSAVLTIADGVYPTIASGSFRRFPIYPGVTQPSIWLINNASGTDSIAKITAEVQR